MRQLLPVFFGAIVLCSCNTTQKLQRTEYQPLTAENITRVDGKYEYGVWDRLGHGYVKGQDSTCRTRLTVLNPRRIKIDLLRNDSLLRSSTIKGKLRPNGYFSVRQQMFLIPLFPVWFQYSRYKEDFILTNNNDLHVAQSSAEIGIVLIISGGSRQRNEYILKRIQ